MSGNFSLGWMPLNWPPRLACHASSMLMYVQPWLTSPLLTIALAAASVLAWSTLGPQQFQEFHPIGGVSASVSPTTILKSFLSSPLAFFARKVTLYSQALSIVPVI